MKKDTNIKKIVEEICTLAPELTDKKQEVTQIVQTLVEHKPNVVIDATFVEDLRIRIQGSIRTQKVEQEELSESLIQKTMKIFNNKAAYSVATLALLVLIVMPFIDSPSESYKAGFALTPQVKDAGEKMAFGSLAMYSNSGDSAIAVKEMAMN